MKFLEYRITLVPLMLSKFGGVMTPFFDYMVWFCMCAPVPCDAFKIHYVLVLFMTQKKKSVL